MSEEIEENSAIFWNLASISFISSLFESEEWKVGIRRAPNMLTIGILCEN